MRSKARGFTYLVVLIMLAALGAGLASVGVVWHSAQQREREEELIFIGEQFQRAIRSYVEGSPGAAKEFPKNLDDLIEDRRQPVVRRHLRRIFIDPMTRTTTWGLILRPDGRITGVHSLSSDRAFRTAGLPTGISGSTYSQWKFAYEESSTVPPGTVAAAPSTPPGTSPPAQIPPSPDVAPVPPVVDNTPQVKDPNPQSRCTDERRDAMLRCMDMTDASERRKCESASSRSYATCLRNLGR